jgi:2-phospho-L-lactate guanylyltransferase
VLVHRTSAAPGIAIAPDTRHLGTNILFVKPPLVLPFHFGPDSFSRHCREAAALGLACVVHDAPALAVDLDTPHDLEHLVQSLGSFRRDEDLARLAGCTRNARGWSA